MFSRHYHNRFLLNTNLILIGQNDEVEVDENSIEVEEFEEIEDEEDEETVDEDVPIERIVDENFVNRNNEINVNVPPIQPVERMMNQQRDIQPRVQPNHDEFDDKFIKRYCLETGTITQLPLMNVIRKIEFFIQFPNEI